MIPFTVLGGTELKFIQRGFDKTSLVTIYTILGPVMLGLKILSNYVVGHIGKNKLLKFFHILMWFLPLKIFLNLLILSGFMNKLN
jgi:hypothetical protein